jgi:hypothetical protein
MGHEEVLHAARELRLVDGIVLGRGVDFKRSEWEVNFDGRARGRNLEQGFGRR